MQRKPTSTQVRRAHAVLIGLVFLLGGATIATPAPEGRCGEREVTVMTRNLYFGASLDNLLTAGSLMDVLLEVDAVWQSVGDTDFPVRAEALADEIVATHPDLIGLQEAALWRIQSPGDILIGGNVPATDVAFDFVQILLDELGSRGAPYEVVVSLDQLDAELPSITGDDIRLTDRDVILARTDLPHGYLQVLGTDSGRFATLLPLSVGGVPLTVNRGWVAADVKVRGKEFRFLNTHLEVVPDFIQEAQAAELLAGPAAVAGPVICLGDFNSDAFGAGTDSYEILLAGGFEDAWIDAHPLDPGLTWGHDADLLNVSPALTERLDLVLYRGDFEVQCADVLGEESGDQAPGGLWPSDHAGVVVSFTIKGRFQ